MKLKISRNNNTYTNHTWAQQNLIGLDIQNLNISFRLCRSQTRNTRKMLIKVKVMSQWVFDFHKNMLIKLFVLYSPIGICSNFFLMLSDSNWKRGELITGRYFKFMKYVNFSIYFIEDYEFHCHKVYWFYGKYMNHFGALHNNFCYISWMWCNCYKYV